MKQYKVTGMSCAACSARVEKAVSAVSGVDSVSVSLLTNSMGVEGSASDDAIVKAVVDAGYGAQPLASGEDDAPAIDLEDTETPKMVRRLVTSVIILIPLMYISMGHMMWNWPIPSFLEGRHLALGLVEMILCIIIMIINRKFFTSGFKGLVHRAPNMDTLVAMGSGVSFIWSIFVLFSTTNVHGLYFESAATILTLITIGKTLESYSKGRTTDALKSLMKLAPKTAIVLVDGKEVETPIADVKPGDIFLVRPGDSIPVDGTVIEGESAVNESALTGESIPVDKCAGDNVSAATTNTSGFIKCQAARVGQDTTFAQIIKMVSDAAATKAPAARMADKVSGIFVPAVIGLALLTLIIWLLVGAEFNFALTRAIAILVISCPCALGLATPVAIMVGNGMGARNGILFKTAAALEEAGKTQVAVLDKTGTVTAGQPVVTDIIPAIGFDADQLLLMAASLEAKSEHPLSKAVSDRASQEEVTLFDTSDFTAVSGKGLKAKYENQPLAGGNLKFIKTFADVSEDMVKTGESLAETGKTPLYFAYAGKLLGIIAVADVIKEDSAEAIKQLKGMGIKVVMLTGDNAKTASAIASEAGIDEVIAGVLPQGKEREIARLKEAGLHICMIGDGINDAPALTSADTGMAIGAGTDVAIDAADAVLVKSSPVDAAAAIRLSRATLRNIRQNLFWAFIYNVICIPIAAGLWYPLFGWELSPMLGAAAMSLSSFCVCMNALRLNLLDVHSYKHDKCRDVPKLPEREEIPEEDAEQELTILTGGMMCHHCEMFMSKALMKLDGIDAVSADFETNTVKLTLSAPVETETIKEAVQKAGYEFKGVQ
ncbi:MAG: heavy metal translocating P-type ATPase [Firmicutes bacterium]|nr:heavy metal translocating P-type ATPase [Bacillota bacterium]